MKSVQIYFLFIWIPIAKGHFNIIRCYVCDDCDVFDDCLLQSCPEITTITTSSSTTKQTTHGPVYTSTPATPYPTEPTPAPILTSSKRPTTPTTTTTRKPTSSEQPMPPMIPSAHTTWNTPGTALTEGITESSDSDIDTTTADEATTTEIPSSSTSATAEQTTDESTWEAEQSTKNVAKGLETDYSFKSVILHWPVVSYHCYSIDIVENYKQKKRRGCVKVPVNKNGCTVLKDEFGCSAKNCKLCSTDRCNSCNTLKYSMVALLICVLISFSFK